MPIDNKSRFGLSPEEACSAPLKSIKITAKNLNIINPRCLPIESVICSLCLIQLMNCNIYARVYSLPRHYFLTMPSIAVGLLNTNAVSHSLHHCKVRKKHKGNHCPQGIRETIFQFRKKETVSLFFKSDLKKKY